MEPSYDDHHDNSVWVKVNRCYMLLEQKDKNKKKSEVKIEREK